MVLGYYYCPGVNGEGWLHFGSELEKMVSTFEILMVGVSMNDRTAWP